MRNCILFLLTLSYTTLSLAQTDVGLLYAENSDYNAVLHFDKSFYVTGEIAWYKFYVPQTEANKEAIVNVLVSDKNGEVLDQFYLQANDKRYIEGYYKIPFDFKSDFYRISMLSSEADEQTLATAVIPIYNDLQTANVKITPDSLVNTEQATTALDDLVIEVQLNKSTYSPRETVKGNIVVKDKNGTPVKANISLAVQDASLVANDLLITENITSSLGNNVRVNGTLLGADGEAVSASVLGMYSSLEDRIFYCSADEAGQFDLKPPLFYGKRPVQFIGYQFEHKSIGIRMKERKMPPINKELVFSESVRDYLALSQKRKKIFQIYTALESQLETEKIKLDIQDLEPAFTYIIDEYESFELMRDFFGELITPLKFILKEDSTYRAELYNPSGLYDANTVLSGDPLFIIDGKLTRDADFVARMDMDYIEEVVLMYRPENLRKKFKAIGRSGVVKISTNLRDVKISEKDAENVFSINGLQPKAAFPEFKPNDIPSQQPFFRPQLYWNPNIVTNEGGNADFLFYQSDDVSTFNLQIVAQGTDGKFGTTTKSYSVRIKE